MKNPNKINWWYNKNEKWSEKKQINTLVSKTVGKISNLFRKKSPEEKLSEEGKIFVSTFKKEFQQLNTKDKLDIFEEFEKYYNANYDTSKWTDISWESIQWEISEKMPQSTTLWTIVWNDEFEILLNHIDEEIWKVFINTFKEEFQQLKIEDKLDISAWIHDYYSSNYWFGWPSIPWAEVKWWIEERMPQSIELWIKPWEETISTLLDYMSKEVEDNEKKYSPEEWKSLEEKYGYRLR